MILDPESRSFGSIMSSLVGTVIVSLGDSVLGSPVGPAALAKSAASSAKTTTVGVGEAPRATDGGTCGC